MRTTASRQTVLKAIEIINKKHGYKIILNRDEQKGKYFHFTIKSEESGVTGTKITYSGRKSIYANWYAHGNLFDEIFGLEPDTVIYSGGKKITKYYGNWEDFNVGSVLHPLYASDVSIEDDTDVEELIRFVKNNNILKF